MNVARFRCDSHQYKKNKKKKKINLLPSFGNISQNPIKLIVAILGTSTIITYLPEYINVLKRSHFIQEAARVLKIT